MKKMRWKRQKLLDQGKELICDLIFPKRCIICDDLMEQREGQIHGKCVKMLFPVAGAVCMHCGRPLISATHEFCYDCARANSARIKGQKGKENKETFLQGKSLFLYKGEIKQTMYRYKYGNKREYASFFAQQALSKYGDWLASIEVDAILAVPMYQKKEQKRGYNQAAVFAKALVEQWARSNAYEGSTPVCDTRAILRVKNTRPMKELSDIERKNNLKNAFQTTENIVKYKKVLLVDDIYTTGSTADAVAKVLYAAGVSEVYFLSICIGKGV